MKIIGVVPTYNRPALLLRNIGCLLEQTVPLERIIIVDNASEPETRQALQDAGYLDHDRIEYVRIDVNIGASGGFKTAMQEAMSRGADWIWGMDDDAFPEPDALAQLLRANEKGEYDCLWSNVDEDTDFVGETKEVDHLIFVGYLVSRRLVERVGYPDLRFYMYHDDTEYSERIVRHGYAIVKVRDSVIEHRGFNKRGNPFTTYTTPVGSFTVMNCEPYRVYYIFRNLYFIKPQGAARVRYVLRALLIDLPKYLATRPWSGLAIGIGMAHALLNKRGRVDFSGPFLKTYY
jgi:GT2 family glycosyltransferase